MSVYDKELVINGKTVNSPEQQVWQNAKDIKNLQQQVAPWYKTSSSLTSSVTSIAISSTNAPEDTTQGFLLDPAGKLFKITAGDGTTLLLEYYSQLTVTQESGGDVPTTGNIKIVNEMDINNNTELPSLMCGEELVSKDGNRFNIFLSGSYGSSGFSYTTADSSVFTNSNVNTTRANQTTKNNAGVFEFGGSLIFKKFIDGDGNTRYGLTSSSSSSSETTQFIQLQIFQMSRYDELGSKTTLYKRYEADLDIYYYDFSDNTYKVQNLTGLTTTSGGSTVTSTNRFLAGYMNFKFKANIAVLGIEVNKISICACDSSYNPLPEAVLDDKYPYNTEE